MSEDPFKFFTFIVLVLQKTINNFIFFLRKTNREKWKIPVNLHYLLWLYSANETN